jgi:hypothetical protein
MARPRRRRPVRVAWGCFLTGPIASPSVPRTSPVNDEPLRPIERRLLRLVDEGVDDVELARRFRRSPDHIQRILDLARLPARSGRPESAELRPLERRVLRWRDQGVGLTELADRFRRTTRGLAQVERLARYKQAR